LASRQPNERGLKGLLPRLSVPVILVIVVNRVVLDRIAAHEHRKRGNLIQHILWRYVHELDDA
jgi:hypothetical protein